MTPPPVIFEFGVGPKGIRDRSGVLRGSRALLRGALFSSRLGVLGGGVDGAACSGVVWLGEYSLLEETFCWGGAIPFFIVLDGIFPKPMQWSR